MAPVAIIISAQDFCLGTPKACGFSWAEFDQSYPWQSLALSPFIMISYCYFCYFVCNSITTDTTIKDWFTAQLDWFLSQIRKMMYLFGNWLESSINISDHFELYPSMLSQDTTGHVLLNNTQLVLVCNVPLQKQEQRSPQDFSKLEGFLSWLAKNLQSLCGRLWSLDVLWCILKYFLGFTILFSWKNETFMGL